MAQINKKMASENIRTVREIILDEKKIVTYVTLSKDLCIHINDAKSLLQKVVEEIKENNTSVHLNTTFLISGLTSNNSGLTTVCPESKLEAHKEKFKTVFYSHIYSVCLGSGVDNAALASINSFEDVLLCAGLIKGISCAKRSSDEIDTLKCNSQRAINDEKPVLPFKKDIKAETNNSAHKSNKTNDVVKIQETKSEPVIKSEVLSPKKNTVNGNSVTKNVTKPSKGIAGFFTKSNSEPVSKTAKVSKETIKMPVRKPENTPEVKKEPKIEKKDEEIMEVDVESPVKIIKKEPESAKKTNGKKNSSLSQIKKTAKVDKKRKRVLHVSDSESDDNDPFADKELPNNDSEDEIPPTPTVNNVKITSGILNPKKRRKVVDKTYTDEEGYILTRKEEVYESCSDEEMETVKPEQVPVKTEKENIEKTNKAKSEVSPKEKKVKNSKKKVSPPQKGKQGNIMNFFKKI